jgi:multidrug resistance protein
MTQDAERLRTERKKGAVDSMPDIPPGVRKRMLVSLTGQVFLSVLGVGIVGPVLPLYARSFGVSAALAGSLVTAFGLARLMTNIPAGRLADYVGRRPLLIGGMALVSVSALLTGLAQSFIPLLFFRFMQGVGSAVQTTAALIVLSDISTPEDRGRTMSLYMGSLLLGASLGPSIGGLVGEQWGFRAPFFAYSALTLCGATWAFFLAPETRHLASAGGSKRKGVESEGGLRASLAVLRTLLGNRSFVLVSLLMVVVFVTRAGSRATVLPLFGDSVGLGPGQIGIVLTVMAGVNLVTVRPAGSFADRYGRKAVILPAALVSAAALVAFTYSHNYATFIASGALLGLGTGFVGPAPAAYAADLARPGQSGLTMGLFKTFGDVGVTTGPLIMGWLSDRFSYGTAFYVNATLFAVAGLAFGLFAQETRKERAER